ncbi:hypothetical protein HanXRQr2_Chr04g0179401 [Helianthus annuus]|uniref:Uncharacterized protein n=1 Tax=Helianthus annuus TaxID=4232 RepID=A0A9K3JA92_HELAN|nr:hypothetical protein HanXRQr2_Chr04g0179401 [Helianthus annuus]
MELISRMKMTRFKTFWIQMWKNKPLYESRKTGQTSGMKIAFYAFEKRAKKCSRSTRPALKITHFDPLSNLPVLPP